MRTAEGAGGTLARLRSEPASLLAPMTAVTVRNLRQGNAGASDGQESAECGQVERRRHRVPGEGSPNGSVNENKFSNGYPDELSENMKYLDTLGSPHTYNHYPTGWPVAFS